MPTLTTINEYVATISEFMSVDECLQMIDLSETLGFADAPITTSAGPAMRKDVRNNDRVMHDDPRLAEQYWQRAKPFLPEQLGGTIAVGLNDRFRFYRYDPGQQFNWHLDGAYHAPNGDSSRLTFLIYLNDEFVGGETSFEDLDIKPETGLALVFKHQLLHKGQPVVFGRKYVLRSDVMYRRVAST